MIYTGTHSMALGLLFQVISGVENGRCSSCLVSSRHLVHLSFSPVFNFLFCLFSLPFSRSLFCSLFSVLSSLLSRSRSLLSLFLFHLNSVVSFPFVSYVHQPMFLHSNHGRNNGNKKQHTNTETHHICTWHMHTDTMEHGALTYTASILIYRHM